MKPQYTKGQKLIAIWQNGKPRIDICVEREDKKLTTIETRFALYSVNIIQSLADSLEVNAVELAQRMGEGNVIQEILLVLRAFNHPDHKLDCQDILSKLEGTNK